MISFILVFAFINNFAYNTVNSEEIENVYIDALIQRYLYIENQLWDKVYGSTTNDYNEIISDIRSKHMDILTDQYLAHLMNNDYFNKFIDNIDFNIFTNYDQESQQLILFTQIENGRAQPHSETYSTVDIAFGVYNQTIQQKLFETIKKDSEAYNCDDTTKAIGSANSDVFMFFEILSAKMLVSYIFNQRVNMIQVVKRHFEQHDFTILRKEFQSRYNEIKDLARDNIRAANRIIWMCDKPIYSYDISVQVTNFLRGYIDNEINLNSEGSCWKTCSDYKFARNHGCYEGTFCDKQKKNGINDAVCSGTIVDCLFIDKSMQVCPSVDIEHRRYQYIQHGCDVNDNDDLNINKNHCEKSGRHFGRYSICHTGLINVESWRKFWLIECDYCFCYCDEKNIDSDRYFSLKPVVSDVAENKIITGVALVKRNGIFSWTVTQSKLLRHGRVQQFIYNSEEDDIFSDFKRTDPGIVDGLDYHTLSWQNRSVNLDSVILDPGFVVTGIRFVTVQGHLILQIRGTKFILNTGLLLDESEWVSSSNTNEKTNLLLTRPRPSFYYYTHHETDKSILDFSGNKFIKFRPSDPDNDLAQTTVPFVDSQMVRPEKLIPLSGVGIYYKSNYKLNWPMGGFIAPSVIVYDMSVYLGNM